MIMVLKLIHDVKKSGLMWVTNGFIWGWLLLPILACGTLIKQDVATNKGKIGKRFQGYFLLTGFIIILWIVSIPGWTLFIEHVMNHDSAHEVYSLAKTMLVFYIIFSFNHLLDSYLYGMGRSDLLLYQALFVNLIYYGIFYALYQANIYVPSLQNITLFFGFGMVINFIITTTMFKWVGYPIKNNDQNKMIPIYSITYNPINKNYHTTHQQSKKTWITNHQTLTTKHHQKPSPKIKLLQDE